MLALELEAIEQFRGLREEEFLARRLYRTSLAWYLQAIGEAASRVSDESRAKAPDVPWTQIVGTRHILAHEYDRLLPAKLWRVLEMHLPALVHALRAALPAFPPAE
jgi:uncharacterized protein with HEPN domain